MTWIVFIVVMLLAAVLAAVIVGILRIFGVRTDFKKMFEAVAIGIVFLPAVALSLMICTAFAAGIGAVSWAVAGSVFPAISAGPVWPWLAFGAAVVVAYLVRYG